MIPLVVIAGFLGAGKTRLLTQLVPALAAHGIRSRIILNDLENAAVDAARLGDLEALVTPLDGECICCTSLRDLLQALYAVPPAQDTVLCIEANGATETVELLAHLATDPRLAHFTQPLQVTVVDGARWGRRWWHNTLERAQVATASRLLLNWTERLSAPARAKLESGVRTVNPHAPFVDAPALAQELAALARVVDADGTRDGRHVATAHTHHHAHNHADDHAHTHEHPYASCVLPLPPRVDRATFSAFVAALPTQVVRAKGLVRFTDRPTEMFVWNRVPGRKGMRLDRAHTHDDADTTALFIGVALPVEELVARVHALSSEQAS
ncbi:MAG: GTP-binding protein [Gemmatimonadetes bacterium]|nr:GTP-binding protein [Gemmatimonadota bacterium]